MPCSKLRVLSFIGVVLMSIQAEVIPAARAGSGLSAQQAFPEDVHVARLVLAVRDGRWAEAEAELKLGANPNKVGKDGISPLIWVMVESFGDYDKAEFLLKAGADPNYRPAKGGPSPMWLAAGGSRSRYLEMYLRHGGNPNLTDNRGRPLLSSATSQERKEQIDLLLAHGADLNLDVPFHHSPVFVAAAAGRFDLVAFFLDRGYRRDLPSLAGATAARVVPPDSDAQRWKDKVVKMLAERGVTHQARP